MVLNPDDAERLTKNELDLADIAEANIDEFLLNTFKNTLNTHVNIPATLLPKDMTPRAKKALFTLYENVGWTVEYKHDQKENLCSYIFSKRPGANYYDK